MRTRLSDYLLVAAISGSGKSFVTAQGIGTDADKTPSVRAIYQDLKIRFGERWWYRPDYMENIRPEKDDRMFEALRWEVKYCGLHPLMTAEKRSVERLILDSVVSKFDVLVWIPSAQTVNRRRADRLAKNATQHLPDKNVDRQLAEFRSLAYSLNIDCLTSDFLILEDVK